MWPKLLGRPLTAVHRWAAVLPQSAFRKVTIHTLSSDFAAATRIEPARLPARVRAGHVLVRVAYAGVNASDINYTAGRYHASKAEAESKLPFDAGFEAVGVIAEVGEGVNGLSAGDSVAVMSYGCFAEFVTIPAAMAIPIPAPLPQIVALLTSGLTASIALEVSGHLKAGETVLVTAAAGGTGQFAVQLAKLAGCHVIATCGGAAKAATLKQLGADRVVDYKREDLQTILKAEYPKGVDVVYESVGGSMFNASLNALAPRGRLIVIGMMDQYKEGWPPSNSPGLPEKLLWKSASVSGFFLLRHAGLFKTHLARLMRLVSGGKLTVLLDASENVGVEGVGAAVARLQGGASAGKVVVRMCREGPPVFRGGGLTHAGGPSKL
ncbi:MAG: hypothetical protein WDW36_004378 [Sanguina aurantia]